ncbi:ABC transporter permease [bacterium]|nr:MAG: ABC transporter permease [bacterium]
MLSGYLKISVRNFKLHPINFFINVFGLSLGLSAFILIMLWVQDEKSVNRFLPDIQRVSQILEHQTYSDNILTTNSTPGILAEALMDEIPEIEYAAGFSWSNSQLFSVGDKHLKFQNIFAGKYFLSIYQLPLLAGTAEASLANPNVISISKDVALAFFNSVDEAIGKTIVVENQTPFQVAAVFDQKKTGTSLTFDVLTPFSVFLDENGWAREWGNNGPRTIVKIANNVDLNHLNHKIGDFIKQRNDGSNVELFAYPYEKMYLYGRFVNGVEQGGRIQYVQLFSIIAIFVLLIACINFMNLSTARSVKRAREVGIRKTLGANNLSLIAQFLLESIVIAFIAGLVSLVMVYILREPFNQITGKEVVLNWLDPKLWGLLLGTSAITGIVAGSYPAFYLSSFEPARVLKGSIKSKGIEVFVRKGLVTLQFVLSFILIVSTLVVYQQIDFIQSKKLGFNKEQLVSVTLDGNLGTQFDVFKQRLLQSPEIVSVTRTSASFTGRNSNFGNIRHLDKRYQILTENIRTDYDFIETMGINLLAGRTFTPDFPNDSNRIVVNEALAKMISVENPIGETINFWGRDWEIIGLINDFHFQSIHNQIAPTVLFHSPESTWSSMVRTKAGSTKEALNYIQEVAKDINPLYPVDYRFLDDSIQQMYRSEQRVGKLSWYFSILAILISCLGLFGLSSFTAEQRTKEIGIRKVMGASVSNLVFLLTKEFTLIILIAIIVATPVALYLLNDWLKTFAFTNGLSVVVFIIAAVISLVIGWLTVSYQSYKAASSDPINSLRYE